MVFMCLTSDLCLSDVRCATPDIQNAETSKPLEQRRMERQR